MIQFMFVLVLGSVFAFCFTLLFLLWAIYNANNTKCKCGWEGSMPESRRCPECWEEIFD